MKLRKWLSRLFVAGTLMLVCGLTACNTSAQTEEIGTAESGFDTTPGTVVLAKPRQTLISIGKPYTTSAQPEERYPDLFAQQLTDGQKTPDTGVHYTDVRMVGYTAEVDFDLDLGEDGKRISALAARTLDMDMDGVKVASNVKFYGSDDGEDWDSLGTAAFPHIGDNAVSEARLVLQETVDYRYIRMSVSRSSGAAFFFVDELEVYADVEEPESVSAGTALYNSETVDTDAWKALSTGVAATPADNRNLASGCTYTYENCTFDDRAPQNDTYLTDGARTGRLFGDSVWVGIRMNGTPAVTVDLGSVQENLYAFRVHTLSAGLHLAFPAGIDVYGSDNGTDYTLLGRIYAPAVTDNHAYTLILPEYIRAQYLRFAIVGGDGNADNFCWIEEIEVMGGYAEEQAEELYPELNFPVVTETVLWDSSDADYTETQNLLRGLTQQVASTKYVAASGADADTRQTAWNSPVLTDGKKASDLYCYDKSWFYSAGGSAIDFFYDIGHLSSIENLTVSLLEQTDWGITRPRFMAVFLSEDGETWYRVGDYTRSDDESFSADAKRLTFDFPLEQAYAARFVRFRVESAALFIDELSATGTKQVTDDTARLADSDFRTTIYYTNPERAQHANTENTSVRATEIALLWDGSKGSDNMLRGFAAYLDEDGNAVDTMMDGFMYFPPSVLPSGAHGHQASVLSDWEYMFDSTFNGKNGLDHLNEVVGELKAELGLSDYKVYVYFSILRLMESCTDFGDVDGDGISESCAVSADRQKIVNWYLDKVMTEFAARNYEHIELDGFCWVNEDVGWEVDDSHIITEVGDCVKAAGTNYLWIPYYTANRYYLGGEMGVDVTSMQPNYMFDLEQPEYRLRVTASRTKRMNMAVEMEHNFQAFSDPLYLRNYMLYLYYGAVTGYMDSIHIYYDNEENISLLAYSDTPLHRFQYDATYRFAKGTLEVTPQTREPLALTVTADTPLTATLNTEGTYSLYTLLTAPAHGSVSVASDGTLVYYPEKGYTGTDSFTYTYNEYLGESAPCAVEITVVQ
ncbi:MAG: DUF4855 domain-containing protein [Clostridia bacterium]|nr:DUF4855 domain-containing protein [Clostridia bacterium]